jgi:hypothetical protein
VSRLPRKCGGFDISRPYAPSQPVTGIALPFILKKQVGGCGLDLYGSGWGPMAGYGEHGIEPSGSIKYGEFLGNLNNYLLHS